MSKNQSRSVRRTLKYFYQSAKPNLVYGLLAVLLVPIGEILVTLIPPVLVASILDKLQNSAIDKSDIWNLLYIYAGSMIVGEIIWRIVIFCMIKFESLTMVNMAHDAIKRLIYKDINFFNNNFAGALTAKFNRYVNVFESFFDTLIFEVLRFTVAVTFTSVVLWSKNYQLVLGFLVLWFCYMLILRRVIKKQMVLNRRTNEKDSLVTAELADILTNVSTVKVNAKEKDEIKRLLKAKRIFSNHQIRGWRFHLYTSEILTVATIILINVISLAVAISSSGENINYANLFLTVALVKDLTGRFWNMGRIIRSFEKVFSDTAEMTAIFETPDQVTDINQPKTKKSFDESIEFENVSFSYPEKPDQKVFSNLNLVINKGQKIGLVGPSGGGKSSLIKLLLRFNDVDSGAIKIDGHDIKEIRQSDLRNLIAYVPQDPSLFHRTLTENIAYTKPKIRNTLLKKIAESAHADDFISKLSEGYDTLVGERGVKLSGGQRQRVAIARAMVKDAPILLLDEATSALDSESENAVQEALWELMHDRTAIVIAHRLSTIQKLDKIVVIEHGQITEVGSHDQLLANNSTYSKLWSHQSGGFITN